MKDFLAAAKADVEEVDTLEFTLTGLDPKPFVIDVPTTGQISLVVASMDEGGAQLLSAVYAFLRGIMNAEDFRRLRTHVANGSIPIAMLIGGDEDNEDGIVDWVIGQASNRPPTRPIDSLPSQKPDGQRSTGRSPGKGSIRSDSVRAAS